MPNLKRRSRSIPREAAKPLIEWPAIAIMLVSSFRVMGRDPRSDVLPLTCDEAQVLQPNGRRRQNFRSSSSKGLPRWLPKPECTNRPSGNATAVAFGQVWSTPVPRRNRGVSEIFKDIGVIRERSGVAVGEHNNRMRAIPRRERSTAGYRDRRQRKLHQ